MDQENNNEVVKPNNSGDRLRKRNTDIKLIKSFFLTNWHLAQKKYDELRHNDPETLANILDRASKGEVTNDEHCPMCGSTMVEKFGKLGKFWGCTRFPECRGIRAIASEIAKVTKEQREEVKNKLSIVLEFVDNIGGLDEARRWLNIAAQSLEMGTTNASRNETGNVNRDYARKENP